MSADDRYARYVATKEARREQLMDLVAEDWERRRWDYWPVGNGVGPHDLREPK